jgi:sigma-B regulation protein RsbU (phosphoserine phosphatase)
VAAIRRDELYLFGFLIAAGLLLFAGRDLLQESVLATWGLTFGGTTAVAILALSLYRVRLDLRASRHLLARREAELEFALQVQSALFPRELPTTGGLEFSAVCIPAHGLSGDYYDVMQLSDGRLVLAIADISGKGISAAILMANLQALLRTLAGMNASPVETCSRLNRHLYQVTDESKYATFFYAEWNPADRRLVYVNAGHLPPIVFGCSQGVRLDKGGIPLGLFPDPEFQMGEVVLKPGDVVLLFSDGITEATSDAGEQFEEHRLISLVRAQLDKPLLEIQERILEAVRGWSGNEPEDDMTLLVARATEGIR